MTDHPDLARLARYAELADGLDFVRAERNRLIVELRRDGLTLEQIAGAADIDMSRVSRIANGTEER